MSRSAVVFAAIILHVAGDVLTTNDVAGEVDPCEDLFSYVCKVRNTTLDHRRANITEQEAQRKEFAENFYLKASSTNSSGAAKIFHNFRKYCSQPTLEEKKRFLKTFNSAAGGWPALNNNWKGDKFDLQATLAKLQSFFFPAVFMITPSNEYCNNTNIIEVIPFFCNMIEDDEYQQFLKQKLSRITDNVDEIISDSLIVYGLYASEKKPKDHDLLTDYKGLKQEIPEINWDRHFEATYGRKLPDSYPVKIQKIKLMKSLIPKIFQVEPKVMANYLLFTLVHSLPDFDEDSFADLFKNFFEHMSLKQHYSDEIKEEMRGMLVSLLRILANTVNLFGDEDKLKNEKEIHEIVFSEILPDIDDSYYDNWYKQVTVSADNCYSSAMELYKIKEKLGTESHFQRYFDPLLFLRYRLKNNIIYTLPTYINKSSAMKFELLTWEPLNFFSHFSRKQMISKSMQECVGEKLTQYEMVGFLEVQIYVKAYFDWAKDKANLMQLEETKYNESSKKVLLERLIAYTCDGSSEFKHTKSVAFANLKEVADIYNCPTGSRFNPHSKCEIV